MFLFEIFSFNDFAFYRFLILSCINLDFMFPVIVHWIVFVPPSVITLNGYFAVQCYITGRALFEK